MARMLRGISVSFACAALVVLCLLPAQIQAQVLYGSLVGNVTDPNGAVVPSASVTATNQSTGVANATTTNASGEYNFVNREELAETNYRKADAACDLLTVRHHKRQVFLLPIYLELFKSGRRNPGIVASGIDQQLGNNRAA